MFLSSCSTWGTPAGKDQLVPLKHEESDLCSGFSIPTNSVNAFVLATGFLSPDWSTPFVFVFPTSAWVFFALMLSFPTIQSFWVSSMHAECPTLFTAQLLNFGLGYLGAGFTLLKRWQPLLRYRAWKLGCPPAQTLPMLPDVEQNIKARWTARTVSLNLRTRFYVAPSGALNELERCGICLQDLVSGRSMVGILPCVHQFHAVCLRRWLLKKAECPTCRGDVG